MSITDSRVSGFPSALSELARASDRFATDEDATRTMVAAVRSGDADRISQALSRAGASSVAYGGRKPRPQFDEDPAPTHVEAFRLVPPDDQRWPIEIEVSITVHC